MVNGQPPIRNMARKKPATRVPTKSNASDTRILRIAASRVFMFLTVSLCGFASPYLVVFMVSRSLPVGHRTSVLFPVVFDLIMSLPLGFRTSVVLPVVFVLYINLPEGFLTCPRTVGDPACVKLARVNTTAKINTTFFILDLLAPIDQISA